MFSGVWTLNFISTALKTNQLEVNTDIRTLRPIARLKEPRDLFALPKERENECAQQLPRWPNECQVRFIIYTRMRKSVTMRTLKSRDSYVMRCRANRVTKPSETFREINLILLKFHMCFLFVCRYCEVCHIPQHCQLSDRFCGTFLYCRSINFHHTQCRVALIARSWHECEKASKCMNFAHTSQRSETYFNRELWRIQRKWKNIEQMKAKINLWVAQHFSYTYDIFSQAINWRKWIFSHIIHEKSCLAAINFHRFFVCFSRSTHKNDEWWKWNRHTWSGFRCYKKSFSLTFNPWKKAAIKTKNKTESAAGRNHNSGKKSVNYRLKSSTKSVESHFHAM